MATDFDQTLEYHFGEQRERPSEGSSSISDVGEVHHRAADCQHLLFAARQRAGKLAAAFDQAGEQAVDPVQRIRKLRRRATCDEAYDEIVLHDEAGKDAATLGHMGDARCGHLVRAQARQTASVGGNHADAGRYQAGNGTQHAGLACAICAEQDKQRAFLDLEDDCCHVAVGNREVLDRQRAHAQAVFAAPR